MATFRPNDSNCYAIAAVTLCLALLSSTVNAGEFSIANSFKSPTEIQCNSQVHIDNIYTAAPGEVYFFGPFDASSNEFWDCEIYNRQSTKQATFRFWGDASHGGSEVAGCSDFCHWQVDESQVSVFVGGTWILKYKWP